MPQRCHRTPHHHTPPPPPQFVSMSNWLPGTVTSPAHVGLEFERLSFLAPFLSFSALAEDSVGVCYLFLSVCFINQNTPQLPKHSHHNYTTAHNHTFNPPQPHHATPQNQTTPHNHTTQPVRGGEQVLPQQQRDSP